MLKKKSYKVCFFTFLKDPSLLELVQWYKNDISILRELGYQVKIATRFREIPWDCDFYFSWWASSSLLPFIKAKVRHKPIAIVAGGSEVVHLDEEPTSASYYGKPWYIRWGIKYCLKKADLVLCVSKAIKREAEDLGANNTFVVYNCIDTELYTPNQEKEKDLIFTISHFTKNHIIRKRLFEIIDAAKIVVSKFPAQKFVIAGAKTDAMDIVIEKVRDENLDKNVRLLSNISEEEKKDIFDRSLIYLQPTLHEAFGVAIAEAMSSGIPVVTSKVAAVPEVVGNCGIYADPYDAKDIAEKLIYLLQNDEVRRKIGRESRERIKRYFSYEHRKKIIKQLLDKMLDSYYV